MKLRGLTLLALLFALLAPAMAQETKKGEAAAAVSTRPKDWVTKVIPVKRVDMSSFLALIKPLGVEVAQSGAFQALIVTGPPEAVAAAEVLIKQYDVPTPAAKNVELTAYLLVAMPQPAQQENTPKELDGVIKQLRSLFAYQGYRALDTLVVRSRQGQGANLTSLGPSSSAGSADQKPPATYTLNIQSIGIAQNNKDNVISLRTLRLSARVPTSPSTATAAVTSGSIYTGFLYADAGFTTDIDIREGQKVVVGKAGIGSTGEALILVVTAKVVD